MPLDTFDSSAANGFIVTIDGIEVPKVTEVSGLKNEVDKIELKQQTSDGKYVVRQLIGRPKAGEFTVTQWLGVLVELSGHYADLDEAQFFGMGHAGLSIHF